MTDAGRTARLTLLAALVAFGACDHDLPTEPAADPGPGATTPAAARGSGGLLVEGAYVIDPARYPLASSPEDLERGAIRLAGAGVLGDSIRRDDVVVVVVAGEPAPRRVLSAAAEGGDLVLDTGPALWSDVVRTGQLGITAPLGPGSAVTLSGLELPAVSLSGSQVVPPLGAQFDLDLCALADSILVDRQLCGDYKEISYTYFATIALAGKVDSLAILDGDIQVSGTMALDLTVDGGGVTGGSPPVFAPCNRGPLPGCISTPTGADLIDWLRTFAPSIPEASLPAVRVCIPGTWVRVASGHWDGIFWVPPRFERCSIASIGTLPTIVKPSVQGVNARIQPRVRGGMTLYAEGDGRLKLRIPIPYLAYAAGYKVTDNLEAKASVGVFVDVILTVKNTAGSVRGDFDEEVRVSQSWTPAAGFSSQTESIRSEQSAGFELENPDSAVVKVGPVVGATLALSLVADEGNNSDEKALLDWLGLGAHAGVEFGAPYEMTWSREQIDPTDPDIDNWHLSTDEFYELKPGAGIDIPELFNPPDVRTSWDTIFEFGRVSLNDTWGQAPLIVETTTSGTGVDADGYTAVVSRYDTLPRILDDGAERPPAVPAFDLGRTLEQAIGTGDRAVFSRALPCVTQYSDYLAPGAVSVLRKAGVAVPNYAMTYGYCDLLVARYQVELTGVAANCVVDGGPVRDDVWLLQRRFGANARTDTATVSFTVQCGDAVPMGALAVTADVPTVVDGAFGIRVDGALGGLAAAGQTTIVDQLATGTRSIELTGLPDYCTSAPVDATVIAGDTAGVVITPSCDIPITALQGTVTGSVTHSGPAPPEDFALNLNGWPRASVTPDRDAIIDGLEAGTPATLLLTHLADWCRTTSLNPVVLHPNTALDPLFQDFATECTTAAIDTLDGQVVTSTFPVASASVQPDGGDAVRLTGPAVPDLLQLAGTTVRVWGVRAGTSLDVYGYRVHSSLGEPRWLGILAERNGGLWLFGEAAIELVDAPPDLASRVGAYVWIGGDEVDVGVVVPRVYGVIRGAGS